MTQPLFRNAAALPDIFDELQDDYRAERGRRLLLRWGGVLGAVALAALLGVGGWQGWRWWQGRQAEQTAALFLEVHRATEQPGADLAAMGERFATVAADAPTGYRTLARLRAAALKAEAGDRDGALTLWDAVAGDVQADALYRDLGALMWALHGLDTLDPARLADRLAPLTEPGNPWNASARELQALVAARRGQSDAARRTLQDLAADAGAPRSLRERASRLAAGVAG